MFDVRLYKLNEKDATIKYYSWFLDPDIQANILWQPSPVVGEGLSQLKAYIAGCNLDPSCLLLGIFVDCEHIGNVKYANICKAQKTSTVGIMIGEVKCRGKGVASKALLAGNRFLNKTYGIENVELRAFKWNKSAISAYQKAGFEKVRNGLVLDAHPEGILMRCSLPHP